MAISDNIFSKCSPAIGNNINECGAVTLCDVITAESDELEDIFTDGAGKYRDMSSLLATQFEIKACGSRVHGLYDFLMSSKKMVGQKRIVTPLGPGNAEIAPFIMAEQHSVINAEYWSVSNLYVTGSTYIIHVRSRTSIPLDERWFVPGMNVFVFARASTGTALRGSFKVVSAQLSSFGGNDTILVTATAENATLGWVAKAAFSGFTGGSPLSAAFLVRGSANVQDVERWCYNRPALNDRKHVAFWYETDRWTMCTDQLYEAHFKRLQENNEYFRLFGDVDATKRNKQLGDMHQREWLNKFFWNKRISTNQTLASYRSLDEVASFSNSTQGLYTPIEGKCVGRKANAIGAYEQLAECGQVFDLQNQRLNLVELFENLIYPIYRARGDQGIPNDTIEIFTDSYTAKQFQRGMVDYYNNISDGLARFNYETKDVVAGKMGKLGFQFREYALDYPECKIRIVTNPFFDDMATAAVAEGIGSTGRFLWILDFASIWPGIITSNRKVHTTGDIEKLAQIDRDYACVMENPTQEVSLNSITWTAVVECPSTSAIVENFNVNLVPAADVGVTPYSDLYST
jgi:hypothetical protein